MSKQQWNFKDVIEEIPNMNQLKIIVSNPKSKNNVKYRKIEITPVLIKKTIKYQIAGYTDTQVFHSNVDYEGLKDYLNKCVEEYKQINLDSEEYHIDILFNKDGKDRTVVKNLHTASESGEERTDDTNNALEAIKMCPLSNNRRKNYILCEGMDIPVFKELGIFTADLKVVNSKYDKFKQINRFVEMVDDVLKNYNGEEINVIDFGCGKSYLTFILYYYLTRVRRMRANITGLDLKAEVIKNCNVLAEKFGYSGLHFEMGDINGYRTTFCVDMVVTLHACDTATDYALYNAIEWDAKYILSVPCCQHEVNKQISSERLNALMKYGLIKERFSSLITDAIRGCLLEYSGYKTDLLEFIDIEHSPKNIMIRAVKTNLSTEKREKAYKEASVIAEEFNLNQTLMRLLKTPK